MQKEILMPKFGLTMEQGIITRWYVKEGDEVSKGDPLFNVETDKITQDVEAEKNGYIAKILEEAGREVKVKTPVAVIVDNVSEIEEAKEAKSKEEAIKPKTEEDKTKEKTEKAEAKKEVKEKEKE